MWILYIDIFPYHRSFVQRISCHLHCSALLFTESTTHQIIIINMWTDTGLFVTRFWWASFVNISLQKQWLSFSRPTCILKRIRSSSSTKMSSNIIMKLHQLFRRHYFCKTVCNHGGTNNVLWDSRGKTILPLFIAAWYAGVCSAVN